jgi:hypothetical protein
MNGAFLDVIKSRSLKEGYACCLQTHQIVKTEFNSIYLKKMEQLIR